MRLEDLIQHVQTMYSRGVHSDDSRLTNRFIYSKLVSARALLLQGSSKEIANPTNGAEQTIDCVELVEVNGSDCYECNETDDCGTLRSRFQIPRTFGGAPYRFVSSLDRSISYDYVEARAERYKRFRRYTSKRPSYYTRDGFLFTSYKEGPRVIAVEGVFEDPIEAYIFESGCETSECKDIYQMEFPIAATKLEKLIESAVVEVAQEFSLSEFDRKGDGNDGVDRKALGNYGKPSYGNG